MDNYGTHKTAIIRRWFARHPRFHPHFTPTYASWLNLVERWFAALETKQLRRGVHDSVRALETAIRNFIDASNTAGQPYVWTKTADEIVTSINTLCREPLVAPFFQVSAGPQNAEQVRDRVELSREHALIEPAVVGAQHRATAAIESHVDAQTRRQDVPGVDRPQTFRRAAGFTALCIDFGEILADRATVIETNAGIRRGRGGSGAWGGTGRSITGGVGGARCSSDQ